MTGSFSGSVMPAAMAAAISTSAGLAVTPPVASFAEVAGLAAVAAHDLQAYIAARHQDSAKATSSNRRLSVLRRFYQWALREKHVSTDPTLKLLTARQAPRLPQTLSEAQVEALLAAPNTETPLGLRDRAMLELLYASGLRVSELVGLPMLSLNLREGVLRITGKGNKERLVPFGEEAADSLQNYLSQSRSVLLVNTIRLRCL